jgi:branched-chain amino acid transport system permease protein
MPDEAAARPNLIRALRKTAVTALLALGLFLPLIGFNTVQNIRNELVLETRWLLLFTFVAIIAGVRLLHLVVVAPIIAERARTPFRLTLPSWTMPAVIGFVLVYPLLAMLIAGPGAGKWIDNFGIQILIYVLLGWGLNIVVGLAGLLDLGYVAFYAIGAYTCALLGKQFDLSFWMLLPLSGVLAAFWGVLRLSGAAAARRLSRGGNARLRRDHPLGADQLEGCDPGQCGYRRPAAPDFLRSAV